MGFLTKLDEEEEENVELKDKEEVRNKEELRKHNASIIDAYMKELTETETKYQIKKNNKDQIQLIKSESVKEEILPKEDLKIKPYEGKSEEISEKIEEIKKVEYSEEELMELFKKETGKNPVWRGKMTKNFIVWKEKRLKKLSRN